MADKGYFVYDETHKFVGKLMDIQFDENRVYLFQVPVKTSQMSVDYRERAKAALRQCLPTGMEAMIVGNDVDLLEILGADAVALRLKGLI